MSDFPDREDAFEIEAPGKTNLWLRVKGKREDGFHEIETRMVALTVADRLRLRWREDESVVLKCSDDSLPMGEENLVVKAVRALEKRLGKTLAVSIELEKHLPSGAGLGGGSSDAAAVLLALNEMGRFELPEDELASVGAEVGSDVPFFIYQRPCDVRGRGEVVTPVSESVPTLNLLLIKPAFGISAAWAYQKWGQSGEYEGFEYGAQETIAGSLVNDLERPVFEKFPVLGEMKRWLRSQDGIEAALLSGSGSTMFAVLSDEVESEPLEAAVRERYGESCWTQQCETA